MTKHNLRFTPGFAPLIAIAMVGACRIDSGNLKPGNKRPEAPSSIDAGLSLEAIGSICGANLSIGMLLSEKAPSNESLRGATANLAIALCGSVDSSDESKWTALGMAVDAPFVFVRAKGDAPMEASDANKALVYVSDKNEMIALRSDGKQIKIGTVVAVEEADPVELAPGVTVQLAIRGEPYELGKFPKETPDADRQIWVTSPDAE